jgi:hypothetical protein
MDASERGAERRTSLCEIEGDARKENGTAIARRARMRTWNLAVFLGAALAVGCSSTVEKNGTGGAGGGTGGSGGNPCFPDSCSGPSTTTGGAPCGGETCSPTEWCDWTDDSCGVMPSSAPTCRPKPNVCSDDVQVCACDGKVYMGGCLASMNSQDLSAKGGCAAPAGDFGCGSTFCSGATQYCELFTEGFTAPTASCHPLPAACNGMTPSCACVAPMSVDCEDVAGEVIVHTHA